MEAQEMATEEQKRQLANRLYTVGQRMRDAQRAYFSLRTPEALKRSKALEKEFDTVLKDCAGLRNPPVTQPDLPLGSSIDDYIDRVPGAEFHHD